MISKRLAALSFAAIQSSVITSANLLFDLAAAPLTDLYLETIRSDVQFQLQAEHGRWTKTALSRMLTLDSTLRESMRMWGFVSRGVLKTVVVKKGVSLPDGTHLPYGTKVGLHAYPVHHDEEIYPNPWEFDAFRFCKAPANKDELSDIHPESMVGKERGIPLVTTSANFMAFSHGKHAWSVYIRDANPFPHHYLTSANRYITTVPVVTSLHNNSNWFLPTSRLTTK
jgi:cytochrome P450